jgi:uncharacterized protein YwqG
VIQSGAGTGSILGQVEGPTLYRMVEKPGRNRLVEVPCEFAVTLDLGEDIEPEDGFANTIGGTPKFLQNDEYPQGGPWRLLLQLDSASAPFSINFGDAGVGYAFISEGGTIGEFLWQCC